MKDDELAERIERDYTSAELGERRRAMLDYATKLTLTPQAMEPADVDALRAAGFEDADVLAICEVVGYYAYVNRIADGLGVNPDGDS